MTAPSGQNGNYIGAAFALLPAGIALLTISGMFLGIGILSSLFPGYKTTALSAAVFWLILGSILTLHILRPFRGLKARVTLIVLALIAVLGAIELPLNLEGSHFVFENWMVHAGFLIGGPLSTPISPMTVVFVILSAVSIFLIIHASNSPGRRDGLPDAAGIIGLLISFTGLTFILSYLYSAPLIYGTMFIPISAPSALAAFFLGLAITIAAGPSAFPRKYFNGSSIRARLLRIFIPLILFIVVSESIVYHEVIILTHNADVILLSVSIAIFSFLTGFAVFRAARSIGGTLENEEKIRILAEDDLERRNRDLSAANEDITAKEEELRQNFEELTRGEQMLRESEEKYRSLFENLLDGYAYCRMLYDNRGNPEDFIYLEVNRAFHEITGTKTVTGKKVTEVFPGIKETFPELFVIYGRVARTGKPEIFDLDFRPVRKWLHISVYSPAPEHFVAIFEDITVRKKAEETQVLLASIVTHSEDAIFGEFNGLITSWNHGAEQIYGYRPDEIIGKPVSILAPPDKQGEIEDNIRKIRVGEPVIMDTVRLRKDGSRVDVSMSISPIKNAEGEVTGASVIAQDITERKHAEKSLMLANNKLNILSQITRHDILNQLTGLRIYLELAHQECTGHELHPEYFGRLMDTTEVIERLITFTRFYEELGVKAPEWQNIQKTAETVAGESPFKGLKIVAETGSLEIYADRLLEKVFFNMYDNALRHGGHVTEIRITFSSKQEGGTLRIEDNGVGIPEDEKKKIFERGFGKHTGMGLFLTREIFSVTGMTIRETGMPGTGARFEIEIPPGGFRFDHKV